MDRLPETRPLPTHTGLPAGVKVVKLGFGTLDEKFWWDLDHLWQCWPHSAIGSMSCGSISGTRACGPRTPPIRTSASPQRRTATGSASPTTLETLGAPSLTTTACSSRLLTWITTDGPTTLRPRTQRSGGATTDIRAIWTLYSRQDRPVQWRHDQLATVEGWLLHLVRPI